MARVLTTHLLEKSLGEAYNKGLLGFVVGISPLLYRDLLLENTAAGELINLDMPQGNTFFATPFGNIRLITSVNTPKDEILFIDEYGKTLGIIKLGGTPNPYRRIVLE